MEVSDADIDQSTEWFYARTHTQFTVWAVWEEIGGAGRQEERQYVYYIMNDQAQMCGGR